MYAVAIGTTRLIAFMRAALPGETDILPVTVQANGILLINRRFRSGAKGFDGSVLRAARAMFAAAAMATFTLQLRHRGIRIGALSVRRLENNPHVVAVMAAEARVRTFSTQGLRRPGFKHDGVWCRIPG